MRLLIDHLYKYPQHRAAAAQLIYQEFWTDVPGYTAAKMEQRLAHAADPDRIPLSLIAVLDDQVVGAINLIEDDGNGPPNLPPIRPPWLAGMVVAQALRGQGIGSALVTALLAHAKRLGYAHVHLGTDGPGFYAQLGGKIAQQRGDAFWIVRFDL
ncbi:MAG: GNAT family N-acetyltransferase [Burkholderiaceae bacterium]